MVTLMALACGADSARQPPDLVRLIPEDPTEIFRRETLLDTDVVLSWDFTDSADLGAWTLNHQASEFTADTRGLTIHPERRFTTLELETEVDGATIDAFEVRVSGLPRHSMSLQWRSKGQGYTKRREVSVPFGSDEGNGSRAFRLALGDHPDWRRSQNQVRLAFRVPKDGEVVIESVDAVVEEVSQSRLVEAISRPWKVELGDDLRNSLLAPPGVSIERAIYVPREGQLWFSYGLQEGAPSPTKFEIRLRSETKGETQIFAEQLDAAGSWKDAILDLSMFDGERVDLEFRTLAETQGAASSFPLWANPETVGRHRDVMNVLFISIDTLRADHLSLYGYPRPTTPFLDRWAFDQGIVFENVIAAAPWTLPAHVSMFTGLNAHRHGVNHPTRDLRHLKTLAGLLRDSGYATLAITGGGFVHPQYGFGRGFDRYQTRGVGMASDLELEQGLSSAVAALEAYRERPFFLFFHTYEVHNPFRARQPFLEELTGRMTEQSVDVVPGQREEHNGFLEIRTLKTTEADTQESTTTSDDPYALALDLYDSQIANADRAVGLLLDSLDRLDLADKTLVVLTSDHGELFGEHGLANHISLYEDNLRVPLILKAPRRSWQGRRIAEQVRSIDIMPTLLELLDLPIPGDLDGVSLVPLVETGRQEARDAVAISYAAASNHGLSVRQENRSKYHFRNHAWESDEPVEMFFDLANDPVEERPLVSPDTESKRLKTFLLRRFANESPGLRIRLSNLDATAPLVGTLRGPDLQIGRPKALDAESAILRRQSGGRARFEVPPGRVAEIFLEGATRPVEVRILAPGAPGVPIEIDPRSLDAVQAIRRTQEGFDSAVLSDPTGDGVFLWWQGHRPDSSDELTPIDPELQQQLEALGYVDN